MTYFVEFEILSHRYSTEWMLAAEKKIKVFKIVFCGVVHYRYLRQNCFQVFERKKKVKREIANSQPLKPTLSPIG